MFNFSLCWCQQKWLQSKSQRKALTQCPLVGTFIKMRIAVSSWDFSLTLASPGWGTSTDLHSLKWHQEATQPQRTGEVILAPGTVTQSLHPVHRVNTESHPVPRLSDSVLTKSFVLLCGRRQAGWRAVAAAKPQHPFKPGTSSMHFWQCRDLKPLFWNSLGEATLCGRRLQRLALGPCLSSSECSLIAGPGPALEMGSLGLLILGEMWKWGHSVKGELECSQEQKVKTLLSS